MLNNITGCTSRFHSHWVYMQWLLWVWFANLTLQKSQHFSTKCSCYVLKAPFPGKWPDNIAPIKTIFNNLAFAYNINFYIKQNNSNVVHIPAPAWGTNTEIPYWCVTTQIWVQGIVLLTGWTFALTNQKHYSGLGSDTSSVSVSWKSTSWGVNTCRSYFSAMHENVASRHEQVGIR